MLSSAASLALLLRLLAPIAASGGPDACSGDGAANCTAEVDESGMLQHAQGGKWPAIASFQTAHGRYVRACNAGYEPYNWGIDASSEKVSDWERFNVYYSGDHSSVSLKSFHDNWVNADEAGNLYNNPDGYQQWFKLDVTGDKKWGFQSSKNDKWWSADNKPPGVWPVRAVAEKVSGWEAFAITKEAFKGDHPNK